MGEKKDSQSQKQSKTSKNQQRTGCVFKGMFVALSYLVKDLGYDRIETTIFIHRAVFFSSSCTQECPVVAFGNRYAGWVGVYKSPQIPSDEEAV